MEYRISNAGTHLLIRITGVPSSKEVIALMKDQVEALRSAGLNRTLIELRVAKDLDFVATLSVLDAVPQIAYPPDFKTALLLLDEQARRSAQFAEEAAENRGFPMRAFSERDAALKWLLA